MERTSMQETTVTTTPLSPTTSEAYSEHAAPGNQNVHPLSQAQEQTSADKATSAFEKSTVEIALQLLPVDGHTEGRRIRTAVSVNGKTLRLGSLRANALPVLLASLTGQDSDQLLERLARYIANCQQQANAVQRSPVQKTPARPPMNSSSTAIPDAQPSLLDAPVQSLLSDESTASQATAI